MRRIAALLLAGLLAACGPRPVTADPALWQVEGPLGRKAWLFGTIHALDAPTFWRSDKVAAALEGSDVVVVEVANLEDEAATAATFASLARTPGLPPLSDRVDPEEKPGLARMLRQQGKADADFADVETWAAALMLARSGPSALEPKYGIDRALLRQARRDDRRIVELEGAAAQLRLFDALPEGDQRALLDAVVDDATSLSGESGSLADAWRTGDIAKIEAETTRGILADPGLRAQLFVLRNEAWKDRIVTMMEDGSTPFVAVGAAHMAGPDGLVALLEARGFTVRRVQ